MSDSTANAREPSMEDILASIRRIIDEEDTRDARPASDMAVDDAQSGEHSHIGTPPVMAAAPVGRDDAARAPVDHDDSGAVEGEQGDAIFPERESLFWSRATGRGQAPADRRDAEPEAPAGPRTDIFRRAQSKLGSAQRPGARERIQSLAARAEERAESVAHDRGSLAELEELSDRGSDHGDADPARDGGADDARADSASAVAALADAHAHGDGLRGEDPVDDDGADDREEALYPDLDGSGILDLTEPLDPVEPSDEDVAPRFDGLSDDEDRMDIARGDTRDDEAGRSDEADEIDGYDPESLQSMFAPDAPEEERDDVLDLTMPLVEDPAPVDTGSVENGDSFHVSGVVEDESEDRSEDAGHAGEDAGYPARVEDDDIEDAITRNLEVQGDDVAADDVEAYEPAPRDAVAEDEAPEDEVSEGEEAPCDAPLNTYSRFDREEGAPEAGPDHDAREDAYRDEEGADDLRAEAGETVSDEIVADETLADDDGSEDDMADRMATDFAASDPAPSDGTAPDEAEEGDDPAAWADEDETGHAGTVPPFDASGTPDTYAAAFMMLDDQPPAGDGSETDGGSRARDLDGLDDLDMGEELGFSDTFSASDVYHDDPPTLDEDYSRSLDVEDEPASSRSGQRDDAPEDDGMEKVGGLVRDAMERDPVDYADPSALVSMTSEEISARALASLADVEGEASRRMFGSLRISDEDGSESLEGMVRGMLRPLLREWLDDNLPTMVESAVRGEVERISAKSRKYSRAADKD